MHLGSSNGPCLLLGYAAAYGIVDVAINTPAHTAMNRFGSLAWLYGRVQLLNAVLEAAADPIGGIVDYPASKPIWDYLEKTKD